ncbi:MAG: galactose oxidase [Cyanobium sp.]
MLLKSRSRQGCMTCHWFRHHANTNAIPLHSCQLHRGLIAHGEHLTSRYQGWTDDMERQLGWAPEVA